jgi:hypothetical protein
VIKITTYGSLQYVLVEAANVLLEVNPADDTKKTEATAKVYILGRPDKAYRVSMEEAERLEKLLGDG